MIDNTFEISMSIGKGGSSKVFLVSDESGNQFAVKMIKRSEDAQGRKYAYMLDQENFVMQQLEFHPNILNSYGFYDNSSV